MMSVHDTSLLQEMEHAIVSFSTGASALDHVVQRLLALRDSLTLKDQEWSREFTQHVATLDSASVEPPTEAKEAAAVNAAVAGAVREISRLIRKKLRENTTK